MKGVVCGRKFCGRCGRWRHLCDFGPKNGSIYPICRTCKRLDYHRTKEDPDVLLPREPFARWLERELAGFTSIAAMAEALGIDKSGCQMILRGWRRADGGVVITKQTVCLSLVDRVLTARGEHIIDLYPELYPDEELEVAA